MRAVEFARAFHRHVDCPAAHMPGNTVGEALTAYFAVHPKVRSYVLDDLGAVRQHINVFVGSTQIIDRRGLSDSVEAGTTIHVFQALSGG